MRGSFYLGTLNLARTGDIHQCSGTVGRLLCDQELRQGLGQHLYVCAWTMPPQFVTSIIWEEPAPPSCCAWPLISGRSVWTRTLWSKWSISATRHISTPGIYRTAATGSWTVFRAIMTLWGSFQVDLFAFYINIQLPHYYSWCSDPGSEEVDTFLQD